MNIQSIDRRQVLAGLAGAVVVAQAARAEGKKDAHAHHAAHAPSLDTTTSSSSPALAAIAASTAECQQAGRACLAACTEHLAAGMKDMAVCQRAVMNMLAVSEAMADVAAFHNADAKHIKGLAAVCAQFCRACEKACEAHAAHHVECKACMEACKACASACEAL